MNARERVRAALRCEMPDRIPKALAFFAQDLPQLSADDTDEFLRLDVRFVEFDLPPIQADFLSYLERLPRDVHVGRVGQLRTYHTWRYHPEEGPAGPLAGARRVEDIDEFLMSALAQYSPPQQLAEQVAAWHVQGLAVAGSPPHLGGELFEMAYRLRGFDNFLTDLMWRKPLAHYLLDQLTGLMLDSALALAQAGVDVLLLDDDVAMPTDLIIGPATWREFFKPRLQRVIRLAREVASDLLIFYHSDGNFTRLAPDLVEIGVNVINPVAPDCMDGVAIKREFGDRLAFWGALGSAMLWDHGTPEQIRQEVRLRIQTLGPRGLLLGPAYDADYIPQANLIAYRDAVEEYGTFGHA